MLSDGEDTSSLVPFEEVLELAKRTEVAIYAIGLKDGGGPRNRPMGGFSESDFVLKQFAQETGGKAFFPTSADELPAIYGTVADELAAQYTVGYASRNSAPRRPLAARGRARGAAQHHRPHQAGLLRPDQLAPASRR